MQSLLPPPCYPLFPPKEASWRGWGGDPTMIFNTNMAAYCCVPPVNSVNSCQKLRSPRGGSCEADQLKESEHGNPPTREELGNNAPSDWWRESVLHVETEAIRLAAAACPAIQEEEGAGKERPAAPHKSPYWNELIRPQCLTTGPEYQLGRCH